jgi:hypothetical protein
MWKRAFGVGAVAVSACAGGHGAMGDAATGRDVPPREDVPPAPVGALAGLPMQVSAAEGRFMTHDRCALCHAQAPGVLSDSAGRDVSPPTLWRGSMMSMSGRDPYWLAALEHELTAQPAARSYIEQTCTRCHTPAGAVAFEDVGGRIGFDAIARGTTAAAHLAREGVTCTACHQITGEALGTAASFTGGFVLDTGRRIYGPHASPFTMPMQNMVNYTPTQAAHMTTSALCASCHTVITRALDAQGSPTGPEFPEQVPYLEWRNSAYVAEGTPGATPLTCQGCHMPTRDASGAEIRTILANRPRMLGARSPIGQHTFAGANAYMLSLLADESGWTGAASTPDELRAGAALAEGMLRRAATVTVDPPVRAGDAWTFAVRITNTAGHRFPTAYPSRRAWLHVRVFDAAGAVRFESGRVDARGRLVAADGRSLEGDAVRPHLQEITRDDEVQVYETVMGDARGEVTHVLLRATQYLKDNRLLPRGWRSDHPDARMTSPAGVAGDADFAAGGDVVRVRVSAAGWTPARVEAELLFQTVTPGAVDAVGEGAAAVRLRAMTERHPPTPRVVASARVDVP